MEKKSKMRRCRKGGGQRSKKKKGSLLRSMRNRLEEGSEPNHGTEQKGETNTHLISTGERRESNHRKRVLPNSHKQKETKGPVHRGKDVGHERQA